MQLTPKVLVTFILFTWVRIGALTPSFVQEPADTEVQLGDSATLGCQINSLAQLCQWRLLQDGAVRHRNMLDFLPPDHQGNDCSFHLRYVERGHQGEWECAVWPMNQKNILVSKRAHLTVRNGNVFSATEPPPLQNGNTTKAMEDEELKSTDHLQIEHTTMHTIEHTTMHTTKPTTQHGPRFLHRPRTIERAVGSLVRLVCRLNRPLESCIWIHPTGSAILVPSPNAKYHTKLDIVKNECSLDFTVELLDQGTWQCLVRPHGSKKDLATEITTINVQPLWSRRTAPPEFQQPTFILFGLLGAVLMVAIILLFFIIRQKRNSSLKGLALDSIKAIDRKPRVKSTGVATLKEADKAVMCTLTELPVHITENLRNTSHENRIKYFKNEICGHVYENNMFELGIKQDLFCSAEAEEKCFRDDHTYETIETQAEPKSTYTDQQVRNGYITPENMYLPMGKQNQKNNPTYL